MDDEIGDYVHHAPTCTLCDYVVVAEQEDHDMNGEVIGYEEFHIYICSENTKLPGIP